MLFPELQILAYKDADFAISYNWLREQAVQRVRRISKRKDIHFSPKTEAVRLSN